MKGNVTQCHLSACKSDFIKSRNHHKFCSSACRRKHNRQIKGKPEFPAFIANKSAGAISYPSQVNNTGYMPSIWRYILSLGTYGLLRFNNRSVIQSALAAGISYSIGKSIDDKREEIRQLIPKVPTIKKMIPITKPPITQSRIMSAVTYREADIETIGLKGKYNYLIGDPSKGFYAILTGSPGHGKSTFSIQFSQYFEENHGRVLYLASEQKGLNKPLQNLLKQNSATFKVNTMPTSNTSEIIKDSKAFDLLVIDSINNLRLTPDDIEKIKKENPDLSILAIMQSTKEGNFKGDQRFKHDCDIFMKCERPKVLQTKSRYAPPSELVVFNDA